MTLYEDPERDSPWPAALHRTRRCLRAARRGGAEDPQHRLLPPGHGAGERIADRAQLECPSADRRAQGTWILFVTRNWRITFRIDQEEIEIIDLDYEDYH
jgi:hypothetical protein